MLKRKRDRTLDGSLGTVSHDTSSFMLLDDSAAGPGVESPRPSRALHGVLLSLVALVLFGVIADQADDGAALTQFDAALADQLHGHARTNPAVVALFLRITALGSAMGLTALAVAVAIVLSLRGQRGLSRMWLLVLSGGFLHHVLKRIFQRERPQFEDPFVIETSWSFPSGHAMASLIGYGLLAYLLWLAMPRLRQRLAIVAAVTFVVLAIGFSRLYLGAHYFSDVIGGYAAGAVWLSASISGIEVFRRRSRPIPVWAASLPDPATTTGREEAAPARSRGYDQPVIAACAATTPTAAATPTRRLSVMVEGSDSAICPIRAAEVPHTSATSNGNESCDSTQ